MTEKTEAVLTKLLAKISFQSKSKSKSTSRAQPISQKSFYSCVALGICCMCMLQCGHLSSPVLPEIIEFGGNQEGNVAAISHVNFGRIYTEMCHMESFGSPRYLVDQSAAEWGEQKRFPWRKRTSHYSLLYRKGRNLIVVTSMALLFVLLCCCKGLLGTSSDSLRVGRAVLQSMEVWEEWKVSLGFTISSHGFEPPREGGW